MNEQLQAAKDHAAMELYFCDYQQAIEENQLISNIERETFWHLAMEIYAEKVGDAQWNAAIEKAAEVGLKYSEWYYEHDVYKSILKLKKP